MKLPFNILLAPLLKPHLKYLQAFCQYPTFYICLPYTYFYGTLGFFISVLHLKRNFGKVLLENASETRMRALQNPLVIHDIKIIGASMGILQYICLLIGCVTLNDVCNENPESIRTKLRAFMVALFGVSMSVCAIASQPVELELEDNEVAQKLNNVSFARRITKPTIRLVIGYGTFSATVTAITSLLLLIAVMSKKSWWQRGARWLAAPALLVAALETASDASDALLVTILRSSAPPSKIVAQTFATCALITVEILVWYFIAKFFEYNPSIPIEAGEK
ncbi:unnamed protein product, partial [Iphiclides podalirius]